MVCLHIAQGRLLGEVIELRPEIGGDRPKISREEHSRPRTSKFKDPGMSLVCLKGRKEAPVATGWTNEKVGKWRHRDRQGTDHETC